MPRITINGFNPMGAEIMYNKICALFKGEVYDQDMVVEIFPTNVRNLKGESQPYLQLANSDQKHTKRIMGKLKTLGVDIERETLAEFVPKK